VSLDDWVLVIVEAIVNGRRIAREVGDPLEIPAEAIRRAVISESLRADPRGLAIRGARITGVLDLRRVKIDFSIAFERCTFDGRPNLTSTRALAVSFAGSLIPGAVMNRLKVEDGVNLTGVRSTAGIAMIDAEVGGRLNLWSSWLESETRALVLDGAKVGGELQMHNSVCHGEISLTRAELSGEVTFRGSRIRSSTEHAIMFNRATFRSGLNLRDVDVHGVIRGLHAKVTGQIGLVRALVEGPDGTAVSLDGLELRGNIAAQDCRMSGQFRALGASLSGQLLLDRAELRNPGGIALNLEKTRMANSVSLANANFSGSFSAGGSLVEGRLILTGILLSDNRTVMSMQEAVVENSLFMDDVLIYGEVDVMNLDVRGLLDLSGSRIIATDDKLPDRIMFDLEGASLGALHCNPARIDGVLDLSRTKIDVLNFGDPVTAMTAAGWQVRELGESLRESVGTVRSWLDTVPSQMFAAQPWHEIAGVLERGGRPDQARRLRFRAAAKSALLAPPLMRVGRLAYGCLVGFGYYPVLAVGWILIVVALAWWAVASAGAGSFVPAVPSAAASGYRWCSAELTAASPPVCLSSTYPAFEPFYVALGVVSPTGAVANPAWVPLGGPIVGVLSAIKIACWLLAALVLAGFTGLLRKT
jgi:hypothetical protein